MIKKSLSLIEFIFIIVLLSIVTLQFFPKNNTNKLNHAAQKIIMHLKNTRYQAMIDNKFNHEDKFWFRERWTLKFKNCAQKLGGIYYIVYSDKNHKGSANKNETLKDPLSQKWLYSNNDCDASHDESKDILLTKEYQVTKVEVSCNNTSTIGQFSFGYDGAVYTKLGTKSHDTYNYELTQRCDITLYDESNNDITIVVEPNTGYIYQKE